jgi:hypothetical protein
MLTYSVFGVPLIIAVLFVFPTLLILVGAATWVERRFANNRGRQPRLAVKNSGGVDQRQSMIVVRPDNIESEPTIGGSTDAVIETSIEPTATVGGESPAPAQVFAGPEDAGQCPIDPWSPPQAAAPIPRPPIESVAQANLDEIGTSAPGEAAIESENIQERETARENQPARTCEPRPRPSLTDPDFNANADQELTDMAKRLKAAIRGLSKKDAARSAEPAQPAMTASLQSTGSRIVEAPTAASVARVKPKSIYDALEIEMGREMP